MPARGRHIRTKKKRITPSVGLGFDTMLDKASKHKLFGFQRKTAEEKERDKEIIRYNEFVDSQTSQRPKKKARS